VLEASDRIGGRMLVQRGHLQRYLEPEREVAVDG
jgi:monoamine oxidase